MVISNSKWHKLNAKLKILVAHGQQLYNESTIWLSHLKISQVLPWFYHSSPSSFSNHLPQSHLRKYHTFFGSFTSTEIFAISNLLIVSISNYHNQNHDDRNTKFCRISSLLELFYLCDYLDCETCFDISCTLDSFLRWSYSYFPQSQVHFLVRYFSLSSVTRSKHSWL